MKGTINIASCYAIIVSLIIINLSCSSLPEGTVLFTPCDKNVKGEGRNEAFPHRWSALKNMYGTHIGMEILYHQKNKSFFLKLATERVYNCYNYRIGVEWTKSKDKKTMNLIIGKTPHVDESIPPEEGFICETLSGKALYELDITENDSYTYDFSISEKLLKDSGITEPLCHDIYEIKLVNQSAYVTCKESCFLSYQSPIYRR